MEVGKSGWGRIMIYPHPDPRLDLSKVGPAFSPDTEALFVGVADRTYGSVLEFNRKHHNTYLEDIP